MGTRSAAVPAETRCATATSTLAATASTVSAAASIPLTASLATTSTALSIAVTAITLDLMEPISSRGSRGRSSGRGLGLLIRPALGVWLRSEGGVDAGLGLDSVAGEADVNPLRGGGEVVGGVVLAVPVGLCGGVGAVAEAGVGGEFGGRDGLGVGVGEVCGGDGVDLGEACVGDGGVGADGVLGGLGGVLGGLLELVVGGGGEEFDGGLFDLCVCLRY